MTESTSLRALGAFDSTQRAHCGVRRDLTEGTLSVLWGTRGDAGRVRAAERWYRELLESAGATTADVAVAGAEPV